MALLLRLIVLVAISTVYLGVGADVITLNDATFTDKVKERDTLWFVKFCVGWCKHCARANLLWDDLGKAVDMEDGVEIAQVDCTTSKTLCNKLKIRTYPTLKLFYNGEDYKTYSGRRELDDLKQFATEAIVEVTQAEAADEFQQ